METSVPRRLRRELNVLPHVRILEREEVDLLLQEVRLSEGGFVREGEGLVDRACVEVLAHGGEVFTVGSRRVTRGAPMAAVFRYASAHAVPNI